MSHVRTNFNTFVRNTREFSVVELETMTTAEFDALPIADQIHIYNEYRSEYDRLTGRTAPKAEDEKNDASKFADEFERRLDEALARAFPTAEL